MTNNNNLSCFMVLPPYQCKGYGKFLISLSYHLSRLVGRVCGPETPLSDMGKICYKSYWTDVLLGALLEHKGNLSIKELSDITLIREADIIFTLQELNLVKYCKGQYILSTVNPKLIEQHFKAKEDKLKLSKRPIIRFKSELVQH
jgi:histone acetyltransferase MYST1